MTDIIKEYLVGLGFNVDNASYNQFTGAVNRTGESVNKLAGTINSQFAKAALSVTGFVAAANVGIYTFLEALAKADLQNQMFAKKMWMSPENAKAMQTSLKSLGASMQDLYYSPELLERYIALRKQAFQMEAPKGFEAEMKGIRDITFEFQRLKLEGTYALQWIGYYLIKYIDGPLSKFNFSMKDFNNMLVKTMPHWTKQIAEVLSWFVKLGEAGMDSFKTIWGWMKKLADDIPANIKKIALVLIGLTLIFNATPFGKIAFGITSIGAAINDYKVHAAGGDAVFGKFWDSCEKLFKNLKADTALKDTYGSLKGILDTIGQLVPEVGKLTLKMFDFKQSSKDSFGELDTLLNVVIKPALDSINGVLKAIMLSFKAINDLSNGDWSAFTKDMGTAIVSDPEVDKAIKKHDLKGNDPIGDGKKVIDAIKGAIFGTPDNKSGLKSDNPVTKALNFNDETKLAILTITSKISETMKAINNFKNQNTPKSKEEINALLSKIQNMNKSIVILNQQRKSQGLAPVITTNNNKPTSVVITQHYHITGNNPQAIGNAVASNDNKVIIRAIKGVFA